MGCNSTKSESVTTIAKKFPIVPTPKSFDHSNSNLELSYDDVRLVRDSWKQMTKLDDFKMHGTYMMIKAFHQHPEMKPLWKFASHLQTREELLMSPQLRSHGNNVFEAITAAVNSLDKPECLDTLLIELGDRHSTYGAKMDYFPVRIMVIA